MSTHPSYLIRPAQPQDLDRLHDLLLGLQDHLEASNTRIWRMTDGGRGHLRSQIAARIGSASVCALVAEHSADGVVACVFARTVTSNRYQPARSGVVDQLFVRADHRRRGVATRLVDALCRFFAAEGVADLSLRFVAGNHEAAGFWAALGFEPRIITTGANLDTVRSQLHTDPHR